MTTSHTTSHSTNTGNCNKRIRPLTTAPIRLPLPKLDTFSPSTDIVESRASRKEPLLETSQSDPRLEHPASCAKSQPTNLKHASTAGSASPSHACQACPSAPHLQHTISIANVHFLAVRCGTLLRPAVVLTVISWEGTMGIR